MYTGASALLTAESGALYVTLHYNISVEVTFSIFTIAHATVSQQSLMVATTVSMQLEVTPIIQKTNKQAKIKLSYDVAYSRPYFKNSCSIGKNIFQILHRG